MRVLIVKLGAIGDIVHTLPALTAIRANFPAAEIGWAVESKSADIVREHTAIDKIFEIDTRQLRSSAKLPKAVIGAGRAVAELRREKFDVAIDFQGLIKSAFIGIASGAAERWGFSRDALREPAGRFLINRSVKIPPKTHIIHKNMLLAATALGFEPAGAIDFGLRGSPAAGDEAAGIVRKIGSDFALINPAGGWVTKLWPAENFGVLADRLYVELGLTSVIAAGPNDEELARRAVSACRTGTISIERPGLMAFYELARAAKIYIGGDTGPTHIAAAASTPIVGLFGPTEWWRNGSLNPQDICVERLDIGCRADCHRRHCSNWICMQIDVETVFAAVRRRLSV